MIVRESRRGYAVVRPHGEIDCATAPALADALDAAGRDGERVVLDLAAVTFMDTSGIHAIIDSWRAIAARGARLHLIAGDTPLPAFHATRLADAFDWMAREQLR